MRRAGVQEETTLHDRNVLNTRTFDVSGWESKKNIDMEEVGLEVGTPEFSHRRKPRSSVLATCTRTG